MLLICKRGIRKEVVAAVSIVFCLFVGQLDGQKVDGGDDSDMYLEPAEQQSELHPESSNQPNFYPSFPPFENQPLGHSRPFYYQQEGAYSQRSQPFNQQVAFDSPVRYSGFKGRDSFRQASTASDNVGLLGSGNFGVIRGGTFYNDNDGKSSNLETDDDFNSYFHNGHGRPSSFYYGQNNQNPRPYQHEQFANFRDFADINTPTDRQYSQYVVVYVNKNETKTNEPQNNHPKNIIESLALLDQENISTTEVPEKKLSKSKRKLAKLLPEKKYKIKKSTTKVKTSRDLHEPLLALS